MLNIKAKNSSFDMLIKNGMLNCGFGLIRADIKIEDGKIVDIGEVSHSPREEAIDIRDKIILPGFVDVHVHFREPGFSHKETILTGSMAAAAGGYTAVCTMPNLIPAPDSVENIAIEKNLIKEKSKIKIYPLATITKGQMGKGDLVDFQSLKTEIGFSDDGRGVQSEELMRQAMKEVAKFDGIIVAHCEVDELVRGGYIHEGLYCYLHEHKGICSESEWQQVLRDVELAKETGCRYHVCHISTKESVDIIRRAKERGIRVTCETAPHYLLLTDRDLKDEGRFKMNPPIRSASDRAALIEGLQDGTIDCIATDHAPHSLREKSKGLAGSAFGIVGLETAFSLLYTNLVKTGVITMEHLIRVMSLNPRKIFRIGGGLEVGQPADFVVVDLEHEWQIVPERFYSMGKATPFDGWNVEGVVEMTFVDGKRVFPF